MPVEADGDDDRHAGVGFTNGSIWLSGLGEHEVLEPVPDSDGDIDNKIWRFRVFPPCTKGTPRRRAVDLGAFTSRMPSIEARSAVSIATGALV